MGHSPLGEVCLTLGLLKSEEVEAVLARLREGAHARFGELALEMGLVDDEGLARALAHQFRLNMVPDERLARLSVAPEVLDLIPRGLIRERMLVPTFLDAEKRVLSLLTADPTDLPSLRAAQTVARAARLRLFVAPKGAMRRLIERLLPAAELDEVTTVEGAGPSVDPARGTTVIFEPDPERAAALRRLEVAENGTAEVVGDPEQVSAFIEANQADRVFFRGTVAAEVEPYLGAWRRLRPSLQVCQVPGFGASRRSAVPYERSREFFLSLLEHVLGERRDADARARLRRTMGLAADIADELGMAMEHRDAVALAALFADHADAENATEDRRFAEAAAFLDRFSPPYDTRPLLEALGRRVRGDEGPGRHAGAEVLYTARAAARAGADAGEDAVEALSSEAARHDGATFRALNAALRRRGLRNRVAAGGDASFGSTGPIGSMAPLDAPAPEAPAISGRLSDLSLLDVLQTLTLGGKTAVLQILGTAEVGTVQVRQGRLVAAWHGGRAGEAALQTLAELEDGRFEVRFEDSGRTNLSGASEYLMLEALRRRDERRA